MEKTEPTDLTAWVHELFHPRIDAWMQCRASEQRGLALDWLPGTTLEPITKLWWKNTFRNFFGTEGQSQTGPSMAWKSGHRTWMQWIAEGLQSNKAGLLRRGNHPSGQCRR